MSARSFRSVFMVASCAGAALGCYLVSLRVASERAALDEVEAQIVHAERDIRLLQTEIGTRGRLAQLERWNARVLALSAPTADQFLEGGFALARLARPQPKLQLEAPVVLASAPAPKPDQPLEDGADSEEGADENILHLASLTRSDPAVVRPEAPAARPVAPAADDGKAAKSQQLADSRPAARPNRASKADPLAPLATAMTAISKESGRAR